MKEYVIRATWATACWWRETRARDAWRGTTTTSSTTSSRPSTNAARWNASTAYPTARATSSSRVRRTTAKMTLAGWPKTANISNTTTAKATSCSRSLRSCRGAATSSPLLIRSGSRLNWASVSALRHGLAL